MSSFSDKWSSATGVQTKTCADDKDVCPTAANLKKIQRVEIWAEGAAGKAHLDVQSITVKDTSVAAVASSPSSQPPADNDLCKGPVQSGLRYNISTRTTPETL